MRLTRLFEGLDDKDEFENCTICPNNEGYLVPPQYQPEEFHFDHTDAHNAGNKARDAAPPDDSYDAWIEASRKVMAGRGYKRVTSIHGQDYWFKIPIKEDLDDQDQFGKIKVLHRYTDEAGVIYALEDGSTFLYPYNARYSVHLIDPAGNVTRIDYIDDMPEIDRLMANPVSSPFGPEQKQLWRKVVGQPIAEGLDDQDEFTTNCDTCERNQQETGVLLPDFHIAHIQAEDAVSRVIAYTLNWTTGPDVAKRMLDAENAVMHRYGYIGRRGSFGTFWTKGNIKEALDDKDEFKSSYCGFCFQYAGGGPQPGDQDRFHEKHEQAGDAAEQAMHEVQGGWRTRAGRQKYHEVFNARMWEFGYVRRDGNGPWIDITEFHGLKESLDDADEFLVPNVHHYQLEDSTEDNEHWQIDMRNEADDQRLQGEYWVRGGMGKGMYLKANFSQLDDDTAERILTYASGVSAGDYHVDWDQAVADAQRTGY